MRTRAVAWVLAVVVGSGVGIAEELPAREGVTTTAAGREEALGVVLRKGGWALVDEGVAGRSVVGVHMEGKRQGDEDFGVLEELGELRFLVIIGTKMTDVGMVHMGHLAKLRELTIGMNEVGDAGLAHVGDLKELRLLMLRNGGNITDAGMVHVGKLERLQNLYLDETAVTDAGVEHLKGLRQLQRLFLGETKVSDAGMKHLGGMKELVSLNLRGTRVTFAGVTELGGLEELRELWLGKTEMTDAGAKVIGRMTRLESLGLEGTKVTDAGVAELAGMGDLRFLNLSGTGVTDAGLVHLAGMKKLRHLNLAGTAVTDAGVEQLKKFTWLEGVDLSGTKVSTEAAKSLRDGLPRGRVALDGGREYMAMEVAVERVRAEERMKVLEWKDLSTLGTTEMLERFHAANLELKKVDAEYCAGIYRQERAEDSWAKLLEEGTGDREKIGVEMKEARQAVGKIRMTRFLKQYDVGMLDGMAMSAAASYPALIPAADTLTEVPWDEFWGKVDKGEGVDVNLYSIGILVMERKDHQKAWSTKIEKPAFRGGEELYQLAHRCAETKTGFTYLILDEKFRVPNRDGGGRK